MCRWIPCEGTRFARTRACSGRCTGRSEKKSVSRQESLDKDRGEREREVSLRNKICLLDAFVRQIRIITFIVTTSAGEDGEEGERRRRGRRRKEQPAKEKTKTKVQNPPAPSLFFVKPFHFPSFAFTSHSLSHARSSSKFFRTLSGSPGKTHELMAKDRQG